MNSKTEKTARVTYIITIISMAEGFVDNLMIKPILFL